MLSSVACAAGVVPPEEDVAGAGRSAAGGGGHGGSSSFNVGGASAASGGKTSVGGTVASAGGTATAGAATGGTAGAPVSGGGGQANAGVAGSGGSAGGTTVQACATQHFVYVADDVALTSVYVSGTFNAWAEPGTPLVHDAASGAWALSLELAAGSYEYKFVLDGKTWVPDPNNPETHDDTFGGVNSVLTVVCP